MFRQNGGMIRYVVLDQGALRQVKIYHTIFHPTSCADSSHYALLDFRDLTFSVSICKFDMKISRACTVGFGRSLKTGDPADPDANSSQRPDRKRNLRKPFGTKHEQAIYFRLIMGIVQSNG